MNVCGLWVGTMASTVGCSHQRRHWMSIQLSVWTMSTVQCTLPRMALSTQQALSHNIKRRPQNWEQLSLKVVALKQSKRNLIQCTGATFIEGCGVEAIETESY